ncbi:hypothetical protein Fcan01_19267 [Folsomia candida]|uniref:Uncharacterized protein n=1 Tax=Folsomia candida TaxID=158441 RepID=A0A226DLL6_FOLCA|nr:hypothetical protein Fcan01_19267 [Folsomia candida]
MIYFIIPAISKWLDARNLYQVQLSLSSCGDNPDSVFLVDTDVTENNAQNLIREWEFYNLNLNGMLILSSHAFSTEMVTCSSLYYSGRSYPWLAVCLHLTLKKLLNFTDSKLDDGSDLTPEDPKIFYNLILPSFCVDHFILSNSSWRKSVFVYTIKIIQTKVTAISVKSSSFVDSFETFLLPFDTPTWIGLLLSSVAIALIVASPKLLEESLKSGVNSFSKALFWTYACLSGQFSGTGGIMRMLPNSNPFICISVCFFFMIGSEFYQGSLLSSLITRAPPHLPKSNQEVVDLNLEVITTGVAGAKMKTSMVVDGMIPDKMGRIDKDSNLYKMLIQLKNRTILIPSYYQFELGMNISDSFEYEFNGSKRKLKETFAIFDNDQNVDDFVEGLRTKKNLRVKTLDGLGLFYINPIVMDRTWLFPLFSRGLGRICQSGLYDRWRKYDRLGGLRGYVKSQPRRRLFQKNSATIANSAIAKEQPLKINSVISALPHPNGRSSRAGFSNFERCMLILLIRPS